MALTHKESDPVSRNARPPQVHGITLPRTVIRDLDRHLRVGNTFAPAGCDERGAAAEKDDDPEEHPYSAVRRCRRRRRVTMAGQVGDGRSQIIAFEKRVRVFHW